MVSLFTTRWVNLRLRRRKGCYYLWTLCAAAFALLYTLVWFKNVVLSSFGCSNQEIADLVDSICLLYHNNESFGNFCPDLCVTGQIKATSCIPHHIGKEVVFLANWKGSRLVFKSSHLQESLYDQIYWLNPSSGGKEYPEAALFYRMMANSVEKSLDVTLPHVSKRPERLLRDFWTLEYDQILQFPSSWQQKVMNDVWHLIQQPEYLLSKYYKGQRVFPPVLGSCGHFYAVAYHPPLSSYFNIIHPSWKNSFPTRARWALKILHLLKRLDGFSPPLHICDVKIGHFGLASSGDLLYLDLDMVFPEAILKSNMASSQCSEECSFIHCAGKCNQSRGICLQEIHNSNFQRICSKVFNGFTSRKWFGLLSSPPDKLKSELFQILGACDDQNYHLLESLLEKSAEQEEITLH